MRNSPTFVLDLHNVCNQKCPYCIAQDESTKNFNAIEDSTKRSALASFFKSARPMNILLTGGEPMITPGMGAILTSLVKSGNTISLQTNLKEGIVTYMQNVTPDETGWIMATLHSVAYDSRERFAQKLRLLKQEGYPVVAKLILDKFTLKNLESLYDLLAQTGAGILLSPLVYPEATPEDIPVMIYSKNDWRRIAPRINLLSAWLFFSGGFYSKGHPCSAGQNIFYGRLANGLVSGCAHSFPHELGHLYGGNFFPESQKIICGLNRCTCDFNYYTGIVQGLDDTAGFSRLCEGSNVAVSFADFLNWIEHAGIKPLLNLGFADSK